MSVEAVLDVASEALWTIIITAGPLIIISLVVGLIVSIFQAVTSIQEQTLTFVPKLLAIFIGLMIEKEVIAEWKRYSSAIATSKPLRALCPTYSRKR